MYTHIYLKKISVLSLLKGENDACRASADGSSDCSCQAGYSGPPCSGEFILLCNYTLEMFLTNKPPFQINNYLFQCNQITKFMFSEITLPSIIFANAAQGETLVSFT